MNYPAPTAPGWVQPPGSTAAPSFDQLLADARIRMAQQPAPGNNFDMNSVLTTQPVGPIQPIGGDENSNLPPGLRNILNRMPPEVRQMLEQRWASRDGGGRQNFLTGDRGDGGGRDYAPVSAGSGLAGAPSGAAAGQPAQQAGGGFGGLPSWGGQNLGKGWRGATAVATALNPFAGFALEGARRFSNRSFANLQRGRLGIEDPGWLDDFRSGVGKGNDETSLGNVDFGGGSVPVSYSGMLDDGRTSYTPEEAGMRRAAQGYTPRRGGDSNDGGGGASTGAFGGEAGRRSGGAGGGRSGGGGMGRGQSPSDAPGTPF